MNGSEITAMLKLLSWTHIVRQDYFKGCRGYKQEAKRSMDIASSYIDLVKIYVLA